jgi:hypothetical protein
VGGEGDAADKKRATSWVSPRIFAATIGPTPQTTRRTGYIVTMTLPFAWPSLTQRSASTISSNGKRR